RPVRRRGAPRRSARAVQDGHPGRARGPLGPARRPVRQRPDHREALGEVRGRPRRPPQEGGRERLREHELHHPVNATLGTAGLVLGVAASVLGVITLAVGLRRGRPELLETGWSYSLLVLLGAVVAV